MNVLITGGAGFIGTHLVRRLSKSRAHALTVLDNYYRGFERPENGPQPGVRYVQGDVRDATLMAKLASGMDVVFHLAAQSNVMGAVQDLEYSFSTNVAGTFNVLLAARRAAVKRVIFSSSREVYGEQQRLPVAEDSSLTPKNAYGVSKLAGEAYCRVFQSDGLPVTILRLANVYGPGDRDRVIPRFIENALCGEKLILYGGDQVIDFVWIGAVVEAMERLLEMESVREPVNIGSGIGTTVRELGQLVKDAIGSDSEIVTAPSRACETRGFIANVQRAVQLGLLTPVQNPLSELRAVIDCFRASSERAGSLAAKV